MVQCDAVRCLVGLRGAAVSTTPLAVIAVEDEPDGRTSRRADRKTECPKVHSGVAVLSWAAACQWARGGGVGWGAAEMGRRLCKR